MANLDIIMPARATDELPVVRKVSLSDIGDCLRKGLDDFRTMPTHVVFLALIYPIAGMLLVGATFEQGLIPYAYPLAAGFALIGPVAALWMYELSRRRELGLDTSWRHAFDVFHSPSLPAIIGLAALLLIVFAVWMACAEAIYTAHFGYRRESSIYDFARLLLTTPEGRSMIVIGNGVGLLFAIVVGTISVISFPMLLDRNVGFAGAILTSIRVVARNPLVMAVWGLIVAVSLAAGMALFLVGLAVVMPVLGHATWHLYRKAVEPASGERPEYQPRVTGKRYAADFPASLFVASKDDGQSPGR